MRTRNWKKVAYWGAIISPELIVLGVVLISAIPEGFTFAMDRPIPWYSPFTSIAFLLGALFLSPATQLLNLFGIMPFQPAWIAGTLIYGGAVSFLLYKWKFKDMLARNDGVA